MYKSPKYSVSVTYVHSEKTLPKFKRDLYMISDSVFWACKGIAEGIMISVRSLQRSKGDVSDPIKYIYS